MGILEKIKEIEFEVTGRGWSLQGDREGCVLHALQGRQALPVPLCAWGVLPAWAVGSQSITPCAM